MHRKCPKSEAIFADLVGTTSELFFLNQKEDPLSRLRMASHWRRTLRPGSACKVWDEDTARWQAAEVVSLAPGHYQDFVTVKILSDSAPVIISLPTTSECLGEGCFRKKVATTAMDAEKLILHMYSKKAEASIREIEGELPFEDPKNLEARLEEDMVFIRSEFESMLLGFVAPSTLAKLQKQMEAATAPLLRSLEAKNRKLLKGNHVHITDDSQLADAEEDDDDDGDDDDGGDDDDDDGGDDFSEDDNGGRDSDADDGGHGSIGAHHPVRKDGLPDRRFKVNRALRKDGQPDRRFKVNPNNDNSGGGDRSAIPLRKDGQPDRRYTVNRNDHNSGGGGGGSRGAGGGSAVPLRKDGQPDRRFKVNK